MIDRSAPVASWPHPVAWTPDDPDQPLVDYHAHVALPGFDGRAGDAGPETGRSADGRPFYRVGDYRLEGVQYDDTPFRDLDLRLQAMAALGIDAQVLSPNPLTYFHHIAPRTAGEICRWHNDSMADLVARAPHRIAGFAQIPMQAPDLAVTETIRAVRELGLVGPYVGTQHGRDLDDASLDDLWSTCEELDVPVFLHPGVHGTDSPSLDARLARFDLALTVGFLYEETVAVAQLIFGGVLHRHPNLRICVSHGGGAVPWLRERWQRAVEVRPWVPEWLREPGAFDAQLRRLWFDTHTGGPESLGVLTQAVGPDHLVYGTNLAGWDAPRPT